MAEANMEFAALVAKGRKNPFVSPDDREQEAFLGLIDATQRFDPKMERDFEAFARRRIRGAIIDAERSTADLIRVARRTKKGEKSSDTKPRTLSLAAMDYDDMWMLSAPPAKMEIEDREAVDLAIRGLPEKERHVARRYWLDGVSMKQVASELGVDQSRVSQMVPKILERLRGHSALSPYASEAP
jgi:RNA polymerase sigma factor (sigma-70 family)